MSTQPDPRTTQLLEQLNAGNREAEAELLPILYDELHRIADRCMRKEPVHHTFQPTDLLHEVYLKLTASMGAEWNGRAHFLRVAAKAMRHILIDRARAKASEKHGGGRSKVALDEAVQLFEQRGPSLLVIDDALERLASTDVELARIVELHFFAGLSFSEVAAVMNLSERTVYRRWLMARAWLHTEISP